MNTDIEEVMEFIMPRLQMDGIELIKLIHERYLLTEIECMKAIRAARIRLEEGRQI